MFHAKQTPPTFKMQPTMTNDHSTYNLHLPVLPHILFPPEVEPLLLFRGRFLSRLLGQVLSFTFLDVALQDSTDSNRSRLMQLVRAFPKPVMVSHHVGRLHRILQDLRNRSPHIARR